MAGLADRIGEVNQANALLPLGQGQLFHMYRSRGAAAFDALFLKASLFREAAQRKESQLMLGTAEVSDRVGTGPLEGLLVARMVIQSSFSCGDEVFARDLRVVHDTRDESQIARYGAVGTEIAHAELNWHEVPTNAEFAAAREFLKLVGEVAAAQEAVVV